MKYFYRSKINSSLLTFYEKVDDNIFILRLDKGPTASFKDFAARFMALSMEKLKDPQVKITILVATSGDTGAAAIDAIKGKANLNIFVLHPNNRISSVQRKIMLSLIHI